MIILGLFIVWLGFVICVCDIDRRLKKIEKGIKDLIYSVEREYYEALGKSKDGG